jgi:hypothetical protein
MEEGELQDVDDNAKSSRTSETSTLQPLKDTVSKRARDKNNKVTCNREYSYCDVLSNPKRKERKKNPKHQVSNV